MTEPFEKLIAVLPEEVRRALGKLPPSVCGTVQEIRLRAGRPVAVGIRGEEQMITADGRFTVFAGGAIHCTAANLRQTVDRVCERSLYAHQEELRHAFLSAPHGCRIGVAGTAVVENGTVTGYRHPTSLCFRVAREHAGCAKDLAALLCKDGVHGALICGEPSSGKTSILRDLLNEFATRRLSVSVIDERGELAIGDPPGCDVLRGVPKAVGIGHAVRSLAPRVIVFDELGDAAEAAAVCDAMHNGVAVVASVHGKNLEELRHRRGMDVLLKSGAVPYLVQLRGCEAPGEIAEIRKTEAWPSETVGNADRSGSGDGRGIVGRS